MLSGKIRKNKEILSYGLSIAILFILLRFLEFHFLIISHSFELYIGLIAVIFIMLGVWLSKKLNTPKVENLIIERAPVSSDFILNDHEIATRKISKRELEVLQLMANGMSNKEIADTLFVSLNTIKSHSSNLV